MQTESLANLEKSGYAVVKNFLNETEIKEMLSLYETSKPHTFESNKNYKSVLGIKPHSISLKLNNLLIEIRKTTSLKVNSSSKGTIFLPSPGVYTQWHQDHESFYFYQTAFDMLNFWIPLVKPNHDTTGISVLPYDTLEEKGLAHLFKNKGAQRMGNHTGRWQLFNDNTGEVTDIDFNPNDLAIETKTGPGDALILRGDCFHKTQDNNTDRLAVSIRCFYSDGMVDKSIFYSGCEYKKKMIDNNHFLFQKAFNLFDKKETATISELFL